MTIVPVAFDEQPTRICIDNNRRDQRQQPYERRPLDETSHSEACLAPVIG